PLIVKDGVIVKGMNTNNIPPETIESITVLKGEQATKIYGNKGRNGVVLITSKKGASTTQNGTTEVKVTGYANDQKEITKNEGSVYTIVEEMPSFPGGVEALNAFINGNLKYPPIALENGIQGRVFVSFVVGKDGEIKNVKVSRGVDVSIDKEAMRIVKSMPNWYPGKQNGEMVEVAYEIPVSFELKNYRPVSKEKLTVKSYTETKTTYTKSRPDPKESKSKPAVDQGTQTRQLIIVPNPTKDKSTITLEGSDSNKKLDIRVYDMDGKIIRKESKHGPTFSLSFTNIVSGTYLIVANDGTNQYSGHLVVNH
ncbi:MAG TPA: TonB family protein, partial [Prolixibacteraceae bacterium]